MAKINILVFLLIGSKKLCLASERKMERHQIHRLGRNLFVCLFLKNFIFFQKGTAGFEDFTMHVRISVYHKNLSRTENSLKNFLESICHYKISS